MPTGDGGYHIDFADHLHGRSLPLTDLYHSCMQGTGETK